MTARPRCEIHGLPDCAPCLRAEIERLREALTKHGVCDHDCNTMLAWGEGPHKCDCGLRAALEE